MRHCPPGGMNFAVCPPGESREGGGRLAREPKFLDPSRFAEICKSLTRDHCPSTSHSQGVGWAKPSPSHGSGSSVAWDQGDKAPREEVAQLLAREPWLCTGSAPEAAVLPKPAGSQRVTGMGKINAHKLFRKEREGKRRWGE